MTGKPDNRAEVIEAYKQRASRYDRAVKGFDIFARLGFSISRWRRQAIAALALQPGDTVIDVGCGTGLNLPLLYQAVTAQGKIIGVDLSAAMLAEAQQVVRAKRWTNVHLVAADVAQFRFPPQVDGILSTYTLILVPDSGRVINNACAALVPGGRLAVLDMAWPQYCPLWWRYALPFLRSYGVTADTLRRRSWQTIQKSMAARLTDVSLRQLWFGFFYLACGMAAQHEGKKKPEYSVTEVL